ncbi:MAG: Peptidase T [Calditrichaeota bacterium]|nr:Peptidase T [Calditrichota bacterium]
MNDGYRILEKELLDDFLTMVQIDSHSRDERAMADWLTEELRSLGCTVEEDDAGEKVGGNAGNLRVTLKGNTGAPPLLFSSHMDTVKPGEGIKPVIEDGVVRSSGDTILAADDKSGLAVILQLVRLANAQPDVPRPDLEFSIHICEEIGLLGAKHVDTSGFRATAGFVLDDEIVDRVCVASPGAVRLTYRITGKASHAGLAPEKGINAIMVAADALSRMKIGRIDEESTANVGVIEGGTAANVVTENVSIKAEARSHNVDKLRRQVEHMNACFEEACAEWRKKTGSDLPSWEHEEEEDYHPVKFTLDDYPVKLTIAAGKELGWNMGTFVSGGGTDGSVLTHAGIPCVVLGVGMKDIHSTSEHIAVEDLNKAARLCAAIVTAHANGKVK